jgi:hypothetical protein
LQSIAGEIKGSQKKNSGSFYGKETMNKFQAIIEEKAWCFNHPTGKVSRQKKDATKWSNRCGRGWDLYFHPELAIQNEELDCQITIDHPDYIIH